jgi:hypothetical protein
MGFLKKITRPIRKIVKKIVPKEIQPFLPIAASFLPVAPGLGGLFGGIKNPLLQAALKRGTQSALVQSVTDEGDIDPFTTAMAGLSAGLSEVGSAGLPSALKTTQAKLAEQGVSGLGASRVMEGRNLLQQAADIGKSGIMKVADVAKEAGPFKTAATTSGIVATKEAYDAAQEALDEYNRSLTEAGVTDNSERVSLIRRYMSNAGFDESQIESALGRYGYLAAGGRVGYKFGGMPEAVEKVEEKPKEFMIDKLKVTVQPGQSEQMAIMNAMMNDVDEVMPEDRKQEFYRLYLPQLRQSGEISETQYEGLMNELFGEEMQNGGIMNLKGKEMDLRGGGFVPIGAKERADDVPARLSKNDFVFTADAVRAAGGGSVQKGAEKMYNTMKMLEGKIA